MKFLLQIIGPEGCGKSKLVESFSEKVVPVDYVMHSPWNYWLDVPGPKRPTYVFKEKVAEKDFDKLRILITSEFLVLQEMMKEPRQIRNRGLWVYEGEAPLNFKPSIVWYVAKGSNEILL